MTAKDWTMARRLRKAIVNFVQLVPIDSPIHDGSKVANVNEPLSKADLWSGFLRATAFTCVNKTHRIDHAIPILVPKQETLAMLENGMPITTWTLLQPSKYFDIDYIGIDNKLRGTSQNVEHPQASIPVTDRHGNIVLHCASIVIMMDAGVEDTNFSTSKEAAKKGAASSSTPVKPKTGKGKKLEGDDTTNLANSKVKTGKQALEETDDPEGPAEKKFKTKRYDDNAVIAKGYPDVIADHLAAAMVTLKNENVQFLDIRVRGILREYPCISELEQGKAFYEGARFAMATKDQRYRISTTHATLPYYFRHKPLELDEDKKPTRESTNHDKYKVLPYDCYGQSDAQST